jgi:hypothetical protein
MALITLAVTKVRWTWRPLNRPWLSITAKAVRPERWLW